MRAHLSVSWAAVIVAASCSGEGGDGQDPATDAGVGADAGQGIDGGGETPDAGGTVVRLGVRYQMHYDSDGPFETTTAVCDGSAYWGDRCGVCSAGIASPGVALVYTDGDDYQLAECDDLPGETATAVAHCCETPFINVEGPLDVPQSCDDVCAGDGLACTEIAPIYDGFGGSPEPGTALLEYEAGGTTHVITYDGCDATPSATYNDDGDLLPLALHRCACADPAATLPDPPL